MEIIKVVSFDFDGVFVLDSDEIYKKDAWKITFVPYAGKYETLLKKANEMYGWGKPGGRKEILQYVFKGLGEPEEKIEKLIEDTVKVFDNYVQEKILEAGLVPHARKTLKQLRSKGIKLYLNSGTATSALVTSARNLGIEHLFQGILGSTKEPIGGSKVENLTYIKNRENVDFSEILVVGDGNADLHAARECNCPFVGVVNRWNNWREGKELFPVISNLNYLNFFS